MGPDSKLAIRVGIFFTVALILALGLSLQVRGAAFLKKRYDLVANFNQGGGIEPGTRVTLRGVPIGTVKSMDWDAGKYKVRVILDIDQKYEIPENAVARIQVSSLLGGSVVNISFTEGPAQLSYLKQGDEIGTQDVVSIDEVLSTVGNLSQEAEDLIANLNKNQETTLAKINEVIEENRDYVRRSTESFANVGPKLEELSARLNEMTDFMARGEGTIGALYANKDLYDQMLEVSNTATDVANQIKSGKGSLGALIYSDDTINDMKAIMEDLQRAAREVEAAVGENREGFKSLVASLSDAGPRIDAAITNFNEISSKINAGEGTLGKLVNDPALYDDAQKAVNKVGESFENSEEQGVFRSFLGLLFGALI